MYAFVKSLSKPTLLRRLLTVSAAAGLVAGTAFPLALRAQTNCVPPASGLVSWWKGEGNANDAADGNSGTLYGGVTFANGEVGQSFSFNGSTAHVRVPDQPNLRFTNGLSVEAWINPSALGTSQGLITKWGNNQKSFSFGIEPGNNRLYLL